MHITSVWIFIIFPSKELYKIVRISVICCSPRACSKCAMIRPCCFGFFNANFELTGVHYCYIFWSRSSYARNLPKVSGREIMVASPFADLSSFLQNLERILGYCIQLYINCLAILLFTETCSKRHLRQLHSIIYIVILSFLPVLSTFVLSVVFDSLAM